MKKCEILQNHGFTLCTEKGRKAQVESSDTFVKNYNLKIILNSRVAISRIYVNGLLRIGKKVKNRGNLRF